MHPHYILLDEPTAYLDPAGRKRVLEVLRRLHRAGLTVVHVTHGMDDIIDAQDVLVLEGGRLAMTSPPETLFDRSEELRRLGLDIPAVTKLMTRLRASGTPVRTNIFTLDEALDELLSLLGPDAATNTASGPQRGALSGEADGRS